MIAFPLSIIRKTLSPEQRMMLKTSSSVIDLIIDAKGRLIQADVNMSLDDKKIIVDACNNGRPA